METCLLYNVIAFPIHHTKYWPLKAWLKMTYEAYLLLVILKSSKDEVDYKLDKEWQTK